jgi:hypothetical protein
MLAGTAVYGTVRTVVWEDGGGDPASYPIGLKEKAVNDRLLFNTSWIIPFAIQNVKKA